MPRYLKVAIITLAVLNTLALAINFSHPTKAAVGAKSYEDLLDDPDFTRSSCRNGGDESELAWVG